jgi:hypothetical protein
MNSRKDIWKTVEKIVIVNQTRSPCSECGPELAYLVKKINQERSGAPVKRIFTGLPFMQEGPLNRHRGRLCRSWQKRNGTCMPPNQRVRLREVFTKGWCTSSRFEDQAGLIRKCRTGCAVIPARQNNDVLGKPTIRAFDPQMKSVDAGLRRQDGLWGARESILTCAAVTRLIAPSAHVAVNDLTFRARYIHYLWPIIPSDWDSEGAAQLNAHHRSICRPCETPAGPPGSGLWYPAPPVGPPRHMPRPAPRS